ncbi:hypothetical protein [Vibrio makurazakiensis]
MIIRRFHPSVLEALPLAKVELFSGGVYLRSIVQNRNVAEVS